MSASESSGLIEEIEVLEAIYIHELEVMKNDSGEVSSIILQLQPATADDVDQQYVCMTLQLDPPPSYPDALPEITIKNPRGIPDDEIQSLLEAMRKLCAERTGGPMLYEVIELAKESLTEGNIPHGLCMICLEHFCEGESFTRTDCYHHFHEQCLARYVNHCLAETEEQEEAPLRLYAKAEQNKLIVCPVCREEITADPELLSVHTPVEEHVFFGCSEELRSLQAQMAALFEKQRANGSIIDVEAEKNKFLVQKDDVVYLPSEQNAGTSCNTAQIESKSSKRGYRSNTEPENERYKDRNRHRKDKDYRQSYTNDQRNSKFVRDNGRGGQFAERALSDGQLRNQNDGKYGRNVNSTSDRDRQHSYRDEEISTSSEMENLVSDAERMILDREHTGMRRDEHEICDKYSETNQSSGATTKSLSGFVRPGSVGDRSTSDRDRQHGYRVASIELENLVNDPEGFMFETRIDREYKSMRTLIPRMRRDKYNMTKSKHEICDKYSETGRSSGATTKSLSGFVRPGSGGDRSRSYSNWKDRKREGDDRYLERPRSGVGRGSNRGNSRGKPENKSVISDSAVCDDVPPDGIQTDNSKIKTSIEKEGNAAGNYSPKFDIKDAEAANEKTEASGKEKRLKNEHIEDRNMDNNMERPRSGFGRGRNQSNNKPGSNSRNEKSTYKTSVNESNERKGDKNARPRSGFVSERHRDNDRHETDLLESNKKDSTLRTDIKSHNKKDEYMDIDNKSNEDGKNNLGKSNGRMVGSQTRNSKSSYSDDQAVSGRKGDSYDNNNDDRQRSDRFNWRNKAAKISHDGKHNMSDDKSVSECITGYNTVDKETDSRSSSRAHRKEVTHTDDGNRHRGGDKQYRQRSIESTRALRGGFKDENTRHGVNVKNTYMHESLKPRIPDDEFDPYFNDDYEEDRGPSRKESHFPKHGHGRGRARPIRKYKDHHDDYPCLSDRSLERSQNLLNSTDRHFSDTTCDKYADVDICVDKYKHDKTLSKDGINKYNDFKNKSEPPTVCPKKIQVPGKEGGRIGDVTRVGSTDSDNGSIRGPPGFKLKPPPGISIPNRNEKKAVSPPPGF